MNSRQERLCRAAESACACAKRTKPTHERVVAAAERLEAATKAARAAGMNQAAAKAARAQPQNSAQRARKVLYHKHLVPIATDGLEVLAGTAGIDAELRLPRLKDPSTEHLLAAGRVRAVAARYESLYVESRNYEPDFLDRFDNAVRDLERASSTGKVAGRADYTAATRVVKDAVDEVQRCFDSLDARMNEACFEDRALIREWRKASRIPGKIGRPKKRKGKEQPGNDEESDEPPRETGAAD